MVTVVRVTVVMMSVTDHNHLGVRHGDGGSQGDDRDNAEKKDFKACHVCSL